MTKIPLAQAIEILKRTDLVRRDSSHLTEPWKLSAQPDDDFDGSFLVLDPDDDAWTLHFTRGANPTVTVLEEGGMRMVLQSLEEDAPVTVWLYNRTGVPLTLPGPGESRIDRLHKSLSGVVGSSDPAELRIMEGAVRAATVPEEDKVAMLNAIHNLLDEAKLRTPDTSAS